MISVKLAQRAFDAGAARRRRRRAGWPRLDDRVKRGFWHATGGGAVNQERSIRRRSGRRFGATTGGGGRPVGPADGPARTSGQLVLLHGPPGTGKTNALRALGRVAAWCQTDCVLDPERLFADSGYLLEVGMGSDDETTGGGGC